jgi:hypothetical protein
MMLYAPITSSADVKSVTNTAAQFDAEMAIHEWWQFCSSTACFIAQGTNPTASAGDGSVFVAAGQVVMIFGANGAKLSVIRATADGSASLCKVQLW